MRKIKIPPAFLEWPRFSLVFWSKITEEYFQTESNRYLFSYVSDVKDASGYPNAFYLGVRKGGDQWRLVIKGDDPSKSTSILFATANHQLGWRLFSVRWERGSNTLDFSMDAGRIAKETRKIEYDHWPLAKQNCQFHLGGWQDNWDGGLSLLYFYNFRIFDVLLSDADLQTLLEAEGRLLTGISLP